MILIYSVFFICIVLLKHYTFHSNAWDLGIFDEAIWNTTQGNFMFINVKDINYFSDHFSPILLLFVPFYLIGLGGPKLLICTQAIVVALGALPIYWLAKDNLKDEKFHFLFPFAYLFFLPLWHIIVFDFHPESLAITFFLFAFYFLSKEKYSPFLCFVILGAMCKEDMNLIAAFFGLYILFFKKRKILGLILAVAGSFLFFFELQYLIPSFSTGESYLYFDRYAYLGNNFSEIAKTLILRPFYVLKYILIPDKIIYVLCLTGAVGFLCFLSPSTLLLAAPSFAQNILSMYAGQYGFHSQYNSGIIPFLFISAIFGLKNLLKNKDEKFIKKWTKYASRIIIFFIIVSILEFSLGFFPRYTFITQHVLYGHNLLKQIPKNASVSASSNIYPHLAHRKNIWEFPKGIGSADYIIIETLDPIWPLEDKDYPPVLNKLWDEKQYKKVLGFIFLGEVRTPAKSKKEYQEQVNAILKNKKYKILANQEQFLLLKKSSIHEKD